MTSPETALLRLNNRMLLDMGASYHALHMQLPLSSGEGTQTCGEDAYFISRRKNMMGVCDGVSAWSAYGFGNSGYLAFYLMSNTRALAENRDVIDTRQAIIDSYETVWDLHEGHCANIPNGSSTIAVTRLHEDPSTHELSLQYSNLGDCMVLIARPEHFDETTTNLRVVHQSARLYSFHEHAKGIPVPLQLVFYPTQGRKLSTEQSTGIDTQSIAVQEGDVIILATDGLWDNLMLDEAMQIVSSFYNPRKRDAQGEALPVNPHEMAKRLVDEAFRTNIKPDDITAVVAIVRKSK